jgi:pentatricopeptide repeat protein
MYAKCGMLTKAKEEFDELAHRDLVAWTALISGYVEDGHGNKALKCFNEMQEEGIVPDHITFLCIVKACAITGDAKQCREVHINISKRGLVEGDLAIGNALVDMYARCGFLSEMQVVFDHLLVRDIVSWNTLLSGYVGFKCSNETFVYFEQMQIQGFSPDATTLVCLLKACSTIKLIGKCQELHAEIMRQGLLEDDLLIGNALIDAYGKCGLCAEAKKVFDNLANRDVISWNVLLSAFVESGDDAEVFKYCKRMQIEHLSPDVVTFSVILRACANIGCLEKGKELHAEIAKVGLVDKELVSRTLVDMYARCGCLEEAQEIFERLPSRDIIMWTSLITGYAQFGDYRSVYHSCGRMMMDGFVPNMITVFAVLNVCSHSGLVSAGESYFDVMIKDYNILPTLEHYTCIIDLYSRAGQIDKAVAMTRKMPLSPDLTVWHIILGACQKWGNLEVGVLAFERAVQLNEEDRTAYICLSNIYSFVGFKG